MGEFDNGKDLTEKVKDATEEKVDKLGGLIDRAADKLDEKTGGKHADKIEAIQDPVNATTPAEEPPTQRAP
jgi:hypothetical protein